MKTSVSSNTAAYSSVPSPVGGLNALDNLVAMEATDAIALENLVPQPYGCSMRNGFAKFSTGYTGFVTSTAVWAANTGAQKLFAWADNKFYDATLSGPVGAPLIALLNNSWWQSVNFANIAGTHMLAFNGQDDPIWYSAAGVQRLTAAAGPGQWIGVNPNTIIQATVHQHRVWGVQVNTTFGWYTGPDLVAGAVAKFDFGPLFKRGGYLAALATWTIDAGDGSDDHLVAISSEGEAAVYAGINPASATDWRLVGVFFIGPPVAGRRFFCNVSGDLLILTQSGLCSMAAQVTSTAVNAQVDKVYSRKIQFLIGELTTTLGDLNGWQLCYVPSISLLFINIPVASATGSNQLVYNTINGSWCTFTGMDAACWVVVDSVPYFGGSTILYRAWYGHKDNVELDNTGGTSILGFVRQAYSYLEAPAAQKQVGMYRPNFISEAAVGYFADISYDFTLPGIQYPNPPSPIGASSLWGIGIWDSSYWTGGTIAQREWSQARGIGVAASIAMRVSSPGETTWVSTDYSYRVGGPL